MTVIWLMKAGQRPRPCLVLLWRRVVDRTLGTFQPRRPHQCNNCISCRGTEPVQWCTAPHSVLLPPAISSTLWSVTNAYQQYLWPSDHSTSNVWLLWTGRKEGTRPTMNNLLSSILLFLSILTSYISTVPLEAAFQGGKQLVLNGWGKKLTRSMAIIIFVNIVRRHATSLQAYHLLPFRKNSRKSLIWIMEKCLVKTAGEI